MVYYVLFTVYCILHIAHHMLYTVFHKHLMCVDVFMKQYVKHKMKITHVYKEHLYFDQLVSLLQGE